MKFLMIKGNYMTDGNPVTISLSKIESYRLCIFGAENEVPSEFTSITLNSGQVFSVNVPFGKFHKAVEQAARMPAGGIWKL